MFHSYVIPSIEFLLGVRIRRMKLRYHLLKLLVRN